MKYYERIDINGDESRLPKCNDDSRFICHFREINFAMSEVILSNPNLWPRNTFDWYFQPCEIPEISEEEIINWADSVFPTNDNIIRVVEGRFMKMLDRKKGAIIGVKWYKSELAKRMNKP